MKAAQKALRETPYPPAVMKDSRVGDTAVLRDALEKIVRGPVKQPDIEDAEQQLEWSVNIAAIALTHDADASMDYAPVKDVPGDAQVLVKRIQDLEKQLLKERLKGRPVVDTGGLPKATQPTQSDEECALRIQRAVAKMAGWNMPDKGADPALLQELAAHRTAAERQAAERAWEEAVKASASINDAYKVEGRDLESDEGKHIDEALNNCASRIRALPNPYKEEK